MYSYADRIRAVKLYIQYGKRAMTVVRELGYPSRKNLRRWYDAYVEAGDLPRGYRRGRRPRYSAEQKAIAVEHYMGHGRSLAGTHRALGYPCREVLAAWIDELRPGTRRVMISTSVHAPFTPKIRHQAAMALSESQGSTREVAQRVDLPPYYRTQDHPWVDKSW